MIDQRTKTMQLRRSVGTRASVQPVSLLHVLLRVLIEFRYPLAANRCVNDGPVFSRPTVPLYLLPNCCLTIPIDHCHCFTQRFSPTGFILNASDCCHPIALGSHSG
jgi:hypothetical protein